MLATIFLHSAGVTGKLNERTLKVDTAKLGLEVATELPVEKEIISTWFPQNMLI